MDFLFLDFVVNIYILIAVSYVLQIFRAQLRFIDCSSVVVKGKEKGKGI